MDLRHVGSRLSAGEDDEVLLAREILKRQPISPGIVRAESQVTDGLELEPRMPLPVSVQKPLQWLRQRVRDRRRRASLQERTVLRKPRDLGVRLQLLPQKFDRGPRIGLRRSAPRCPACLAAVLMALSFLIRWFRSELGNRGHFEPAVIADKLVDSSTTRR